jgi:hypothetical protein
MKQSDNGLMAEAICLEIGEGESKLESRVDGLQSQISLEVFSRFSDKAANIT